MFVDIHTHNLSKSEYPAIQNLSFSQAESLFSTNENGVFSVGFHPWYADEFSSEKMENLEKWSTDRRLIAIGECGLDKNSQVPIEQQSVIFEQQIMLSERIRKPIIIHCVGCFNQLLKLKKQHKPSQLWIIHGFRGKPELAAQLLKAGCALSFGEHFNAKSVLITPLDKLFIETDESTLPIDEIYRQIAIIKGVNPIKLLAGELLYKQITK